jgi:fructose-1,6-bisphosphatase
MNRIITLDEFIVKQAGGMALNTKLEEILDLRITSLHQTSSIAMGSATMVLEMKEFVERYSAGN